MARLFAAAVVLVVVFPALASEPGQPLDCSDWPVACEWSHEQEALPVVRVPS